MRALIEITVVFFLSCPLLAIDVEGNPLGDVVFEETMTSDEIEFAMSAAVMDNNLDEVRVLADKYDWTNKLKVFELIACAKNWRHLAIVNYLEVRLGAATAQTRVDHTRHTGDEIPWVTLSPEQQACINAFLAEGLGIK